MVLCIRKRISIVHLECFWGCSGVCVYVRSPAFVCIFCVYFFSGSVLFFFSSLLLHAMHVEKLKMGIWWPRFFIVQLMHMQVRWHKTECICMGWKITPNKQSASCSALVLLLLLLLLLLFSSSSSFRALHRFSTTIVSNRIWVKIMRG